MKSFANLPNKLPIFIVYLLGISFLPGYPLSYLLVRIFPGNIPALQTYSSFTVYLFLFFTFAFLGRKYYLQELLNIRRKFIFFIILAITGLILSYFLSIIIGLIDILFRFMPRNSVNQNILDSVIKQAPVLITIMVVVFGPFVEETVFRGIILNSLTKIKTARKINTVLAIVISSFFFGLIHVLPATINNHDYSELILGLPYMAIGLVLGIEYVLSKNIFVSMTTHMLYNLVSTIFILNYMFK